MPSSTFSARLHDAGAAVRSPRLAWRGARPGRPVVLALVAAVGLLAVVYLVLRLTPLSAVQNVTVVGVQGPKASEIRHAIERAANGQSTLGFHDGAVRDAVADTRSITGVEVHTRFPHGVQVEVHQLLAVGAVELDGRRVAVAADGRVLPDWTPGTLPVIRGGRAKGGALTGGGLAAARILGGAPEPILARVARVDGGFTVRLADGPALLFRDGHRLRAKWAAAVAVLSDPGTRGDTWVDLRVPEQPVAGRGAPPQLPARDAKVGRIPTTSDALATAEGLTQAPPSAVEGGTPAASGNARAAGVAATPRAAGATTSAAPAAGTGADGVDAGTGAASSAQTDVPTGDPTTGGGTPAPTPTPTAGAAASGPSTTGGATGTPSTGAAATTNSGAAGTQSGAAGGTGASTENGGGTAPTAQTAP